MTYSSGDGLRHFCICPSCSNFRDDADGTELNKEVIPEFYSEKHAIDAGWRKTKHWRFCSPEEEFVWVCPDCWPGDV